MNESKIRRSKPTLPNARITLTRSQATRYSRWATYGDDLSNPPCPLCEKYKQYFSKPFHAQPSPSELTKQT